MSKALVINGSPNMEKGYTAMISIPFAQGMTDAGFDVEMLYSSRLDIKPCNCGHMFCWDRSPGKCYIKDDDMQLLYPKLRKAEILVLATPVYIPLPGGMQNIINRLCPIIDPILEFREGRTRAKLREGVNISKIVLVSTSGWWERGNFETVIRIVEELAKDCSVEFAGALLRPHAWLMMQKGILTPDGRGVLDAARKAGCELAKNGIISKDTLDLISRPLVSQEEFWRKYVEE